MVKKKLRQAIVTSPFELISLGKKLAIEFQEIDFGKKLSLKQKCLILIINKTPKCSDTWEFE